MGLPHKHNMIEIHMPLLNPDQWAEVQRLFELVAELPPDQQPAFLERVCPDADLRREVASLLQPSEVRLPAAAEAIQWSVEALADDSDPDERLIGTRLGPYRVEAIIGHGGMGAVYRASRDDAEYSQRVAIKLVRPASESRSALLRFRRERQILARLSHPNIARLLDGGSTPDGMPYLVMEFIEGEPITDWSARPSRSVEERLRLFLLVCEAVEFAHRDLIVHRDLKPANILVTREGVPKLLDFGIAKILDPDTDAETVTRTGMPVMTPEYAAPEQVRGEPISPAADVYALGLILYEMSTGVKAQQIPTLTPVVVARVVCHMEPAPPAALQPQLAGDVDNIIRKAIRKEPERRYATGGDLARDIQRHLDGRPVVARPDTLAYRWTKFARRNRAGLVSALLMACLTSGLVFSFAARRKAVPRVLQVVQLTQTGRVHNLGGLAADSSRVYFSEGTGSGWWLSQVSMKGGAPVPLPLSQPIPRPDILDISPDYSNLLVASQVALDDDRPLWIVPTAGGTPRRLGNLLGRVGVWSRDGKNIVFANHATFFQVSMDGTGLRKLGVAPGGLADLHRSPAPLPDRLRFAVFLRRDVLWEADASASVMHPFLKGWSSGEEGGEDGGVWLSSGKYFAFRSRRMQAASIWAVPENRGFLQPFAGGAVKIYSSPLEFVSLAADPGGKRVFLAAGQERPEWVRYDIGRGRFAPFLPGSAGRAVSFSKDGRWVAYASFPDSIHWRSRPDGSERIPLAPGVAGGAPNWSPDGAWIAFAGFKAGQFGKLWVVPSTGGNPEALAECDWEPTWSPDGSSLLYGLAARPGSRERQGLYVIDWRTRAKKMLPGSETILRAAWSPDPRYAAGTNVAGSRILLFDFRTQQWSGLVEGVGLGTPFWSRDGKYVYYQDAFGDPDQPIFRVRIGNRKIERLMGLRQIPQSNVSRYSLAGLGPGDSLVTGLMRTNSDLYALELELP